MDILSFQDAATRRIGNDLTTEGHAWNTYEDDQPRLSLYDPHEMMETPSLRLVCASDDS